MKIRIFAVMYVFSLMIFSLTSNADSPLTSSEHWTQVGTHHFTIDQTDAPFSVGF